MSGKQFAYPRVATYDGLYLVAKGLFLGSRVSTVGSFHPPRFEAIHTLFAQKRFEGLGSEV